jgi:magnesium transporter
MKRLAAYAALLAIPTMIAGIYGMNFEHMPELKWRFGYEFSLLFMGGIDVLLYFQFKKIKWL